MEKVFLETSKNFQSYFFGIAEIHKRGNSKIKLMKERNCLKG